MPRSFMWAEASWLPAFAATSTPAHQQVAHQPTNCANFDGCTLELFSKELTLANKSNLNQFLSREIQYFKIGDGLSKLSLSK